jgi:hypothetical protein
VVIVRGKHEGKVITHNVKTGPFRIEYPALSCQCIYNVHTPDAADVIPSS